MDNKSLKSFLEISYVELEEMNLQAKKRKDNAAEIKLKEFYLNYLKGTKIKSCDNWLF